MDIGPKQPIISYPEDFLERNKFELYRNVKPESFMVETLFVYLEYCILYNRKEKIGSLLNLLQSSSLSKSIQDTLMVYTNSLNQNSLEAIEIIRKDSSIIRALDEVCEELYEAAQKTYAGHIIYEVFAQKLSLNYIVVQLMSPNQSIRFINSEFFLSLYILEVDDQFMYLYPHREHYGAVWLNDSFQIQEPLFLAKNSLERTEEKEENKFEIENFDIDSKKKSEETKCQNCGKPANNTICYCNLCQSCSLYMVTNGFEECPNCSKKFNTSSKLNPTVTQKDLLKYLKSQKDEVKTALDRLSEAKKYFVQKINDTVQFHENELKEYKAYLTKVQKTMKRNPNYCAENLQNAQEIIYSQITMEIDTESFNSAFQLQIPCRNLITSNNQEYNECSVCNRSAGVFFKKCGSKLCSKCLAKSLNQKISKGKYCEKKLNSKSIKKMKKFLADNADNLRKNLDENACMHCEMQFQAHLIVQLSCGCRLCSNCIKDGDLNCPVCTSSIQLQEIEAVRKHEIEKMKKCSYCQTLKYLVCHCACEDCASNLVSPLENLCIECRTPFAKTFLDSQRHNYSSSATEKNGFMFKDCANCKRRQNIPKVCRTCPICINCLKITTDTSRCFRCRDRYTAEGKNRLKQYISH